MEPKQQEKPDFYELVWRVFKNTLIHEACFVFNTDEPIRWKWRRDISSVITLGNSTHYFRSSAHRYFDEGFPLPERGGVLLTENAMSYVRIFMDDLYLCPDCGAFHPIWKYQPNVHWIDLSHRRIDTAAMFEAIEQKRYAKEFEIRRCKHRKECREATKRFHEKFWQEIEQERKDLAWAEKVEEIKRRIPPAGAQAISPPIEVIETPKKLFVYLISGGGYVKIGIATDINKRMLSLQTSCPFRLRLLRSWRCANVQEMESALHRRLAEFRQNGEWFQLSNQVMERLLTVDDLNAFLQEEA